MLGGGFSANQADLVFKRYPGKYGDQFGQYILPYRAEMYGTKIGAAQFVIDKIYINMYQQMAYRKKKLNQDRNHV